MQRPRVHHVAASAIWGVLFGLYLVLGLLALGSARGTAVVLGCAAAAAIFLYVRVYGEDPPRRG